MPGGSAKNNLILLELLYLIWRATSRFVTATVQETMCQMSLFLDVHCPINTFHKTGGASVLSPQLIFFPNWSEYNHKQSSRARRNFQRVRKRLLTSWESRCLRTQAAVCVWTHQTYTKLLMLWRSTVVTCESCWGSQGVEPNEKVKKKRKSVSSADSFELFSFFISSLFPQDFGGHID